MNGCFEPVLGNIFVLLGDLAHEIDVVDAFAAGGLLSLTSTTVTMTVVLAVAVPSQGAAGGWPGQHVMDGIHMRQQHNIFPSVVTGKLVPLVLFEPQLAGSRPASDES